MKTPLGYSKGIESSGLPFNIITVFLLIIVHIALGLVMKFDSIVATSHALITLFVGIAFALTSRSFAKVAFAGAYIVGSEILWRMNKAAIFWEFGKYALIFIFFIAIVRNKKRGMPVSPLVYILLLSISSLFTLEALGMSSEGRQALSFNLSGPLALVISILFFVRWSPTMEELKKLLWWLLLPCIGIGAIALYATITAENLSFGMASNFTTSGGFGPNQVSAVLGLGALSCVILLILEKRPSLRLLFILIVLWLLAQSVLTFSRGGVFNTAISTAIFLVHFIKNRRFLLIMVGLLLAVSLVGGFFIVPKLQSYTEGMLLMRFTDYEPTNRIEIAQADIKVWFDNLMLGVGPGMAKFARTSYFSMEIAPHTEFTRVLAEHGIVGLAGLLLLIWFAIRTYFRSKDGLVSAFIAALLCWSFAEMAHSAMRIAAISFISGLAFIQWGNVFPAVAKGTDLSFSGALRYRANRYPYSR